MWEGDVVVEHRHCARHLHSNFTKKFKGQMLERKMMSAMKANTVEGFRRILEEIKVVDHAAFEWLMDKGLQH